MREWYSFVQNLTEILHQFSGLFILRIKKAGLNLLYYSNLTLQGTTCQKSPFASLTGFNCSTSAHHYCMINS